MSGIYLVRHGETATPGLFLGRSDPPLGELGRRQARQLAETLPAPRRLVSSGLRRATETAAILGDHWGLDPTVDLRFNEISYGEWDGLSWAEIERRWPREAAHKLGQWWEVTPPGGEQSQALVVRLQAGWEDLCAGVKPVVVVAHVGVNAVLTEISRRTTGANLCWGRVEQFSQELGTWVEL